jgi:hypothetical protein
LSLNLSSFIMPARSLSSPQNGSRHIRNGKSTRNEWIFKNVLSWCFCWIRHSKL